MGKEEVMHRDFPNRKRPVRGVAGLSAWSRNMITRTRAKHETCTRQPFRGSMLRCVGVCRVERLDALVALSREERNDAIFVRPVVVTHDPIGTDEGRASLC
jgi:hypothetical protein